MINKAVERDLGGMERSSGNSNSKTSRTPSIAKLIAKSKRDESSFEDLLAESHWEKKEGSINTKHDDNSKIRDYNTRDDREVRQSRKRSRSRSRSRSRDFRNYMASIELSLSSEDIYWKVTILCVMLVLIFLCEHFITNDLVKIMVTILNTVLLVNLVVLSMAADSVKDN